MWLLESQVDEFEEGLNEILEIGILADGEYTALFEKEFMKQFGYKYAIATPSGTTAITALMSVLKIKYGVRTVLIPALTVKDVYQGIKMAGLKVVFADVSKDLPVMGEDEINAVLDREQVDVVFYVHTAGLTKLPEIDLPDDVILIEDCSHAHGIKELGKRGLASVYSFFTTKVLSGIGGIIATNNKKLSEDILKFVRFEFNDMHYGYPFMVPEIHALLCYLDVKYWKELVKLRREQAEYYHKHGIYSLQDQMDYEPTYYKFTLTGKPKSGLYLTGYTHKPPLAELPNAKWWSENHFNLWISRFPEFEKLDTNVKILRR